MKIQLRDFLYTLFKYKIYIIIFIFSSVFVATVYSYSALPKFEASSKILIKIGRQNTPPEAGVYSPPNMITTAKPSFILSSELELLKGRGVAVEIVNRLKDAMFNQQKEVALSLWAKSKQIVKKGVSLVFDGFSAVLVKLGLTEKLSQRDRAILSIWQGLSAEFIKGSNSVKVSFKSGDAKLAAKIVNLAIDIYIKQHAEVHKTEALDFFLNQTEFYRNNLEESEVRLKEFKSHWGISSIDEQTSHLLQLSSNLRKEKYNVEVELTRQNTKVDSINTLLTDWNLDHAGVNITTPNHVVDALKLRLVDLKSKKIELLMKYSDTNPLVMSVNKEVKQIENELKSEEAKSAITVDIVAMESKMEKLTNLLNESNAELSGIDKLRHELNILERNVTENEHFYETYMKKTEEARILQAMDVANMSNIKVIERAFPPILPIRIIGFIPQKIFNIVMAFTVGFFVSISFVALLEMLDHSVKTSEDIEEFLGLNVLGTLSNYKQLENITATHSHNTK